ncbi:MAG TPA: transposase family protein, partial [Solirubrobacteraceae bacterium]|nr:transposase family protein [Solirubrobacteraceae bacterium]
MLLTALFPQLVGFRVERLCRADDHLTLTAVARRKAARCPRCRRRSRRIHSRYQRHVADLPLAGTPVTFELHVRRFVCPNPRCPQRIFAERLPKLVAAGARRSQGLQ